MDRSLLIVGAGVYAALAYEIALDIGDYDKISFVDDNKDFAPNGERVIGKTTNISDIAASYTHAIVAVGNPLFRLSMIERIENETSLEIARLISPHAYISPSATVMKGCIIEPMAVVHTGCTVHEGCLVCAGAVINQAIVLFRGVQIDCNATVSGYTEVPENTKVENGSVYKNNAIDPVKIQFETKR